MPVYMVIEVEVLDPEGYAEYVGRVPAVVRSTSYVTGATAASAR
jgi:uncharacterized protein (DUF1330 family)